MEAEAAHGSLSLCCSCPRSAHPGLQAQPVPALRVDAGVLGMPGRWPSAHGAGCPSPACASSRPAPQSPHLPSRAAALSLRSCVWTCSHRAYPGSTAVCALIREARGRLAPAYLDMTGERLPGRSLPLKSSVLQVPPLPPHSQLGKQTQCLSGHGPASTRPLRGHLLPPAPRSAGSGTGRELQIH